MKFSVVLTKIVTFAAPIEIEAESVDEADRMAEKICQDCEQAIGDPGKTASLVLAHGLRWKEQETEFEIFDLCEVEGDGG